MTQLPPLRTPRIRAVAVLASSGLGLAMLLGTARAAEDEPVAPSLPSVDEDTPREMSRLEILEDRIRELEERLWQEEHRQLAVSPLSINGYVDFGFFWPRGNGGIGWVRDVGNAQFPDYSNYAWTFLGDILATSVNTRGEAASHGDPPGAYRFDSLRSKGAPSFAVNEVNLRVGYQLAESVVLRTSINFIPRTGSDFALGDFIEVDIAEAEWIATEDGSTSFFAGKMLPVFGIEYKERRSHERFGITPSLVQRYTSGTQLGLKVRTKLLNEWLIVAAAVTNGSPTTEQFHFYDEIDSNSGKTVSGRLAINVPVGELIGPLFGHTLEIGGSGVWGPQDRATNNEGAMWFVGVDLTYSAVDWVLKAQWMRGQSPGLALEQVWSLDLGDSGYVELNWLVFPFLGVVGRVELRDAIVTLGTERAYITKSWRATGGLRFVINPHVVLKAEYLHNGEFGGVRPFDNDIFTSSLVLAY